MFYRIYRTIIKKRRDLIYNKIFAKHGLSHANKIRTWTTQDELRTLYQHAISLKTGSTALEIGSYLGASTCYIVAGLIEKSGHITCVDTWNNETIPEGEKDTFAEFQNNIKPVQQYVSCIRKNSYQLCPDDFENQFDFVFIDGDHSYNAARNDFHLAAALTREKGKVFFHDSKYSEGVPRVIGEALASGEWKIGGSVSNMFWIIKK